MDNATKSMIVFIAWKDISHPAAGGAELVHYELSRRLVKDGYAVIHLVPGFPGCLREEQIDGIKIIRVGSSVLAFYRLPFYFARHLRQSTAFLIDVFNCYGSFACLRFDPQRTVLMFLHIQDRMWFYQTSFYNIPEWIMPVFNIAGYFTEKIQLRLLAGLFRGKVATISNSTAAELCGYGFPKERTRIISVGIAQKPLAQLTDSLPKEQHFTIIMIGPRKSKRPLDTLKAFELFHQKHPETLLWIAGWGTEMERLRRYADKRHIHNARFWNQISETLKTELLQRAHLLCTTPVKEGWGLVVVEANAMGTPVAAYDVPGLRDAVAFDNGFLCRPTPENMALTMEKVYQLWASNRPEYESLRSRALESSRKINFDQSYADFSRLLFDQTTADTNQSNTSIPTAAKQRIICSGRS